MEELALQYYASEEGGRWQGMHSEGGVWMTLFGLLMWDILFTDVPDVFQTPFQVYNFVIGMKSFPLVCHSEAQVIPHCISDKIFSFWLYFWF